MKQTRPSLKEIVRIPQVSEFIEKGIVSSEAPSLSDPPISSDGQEITLRIPLPPELYEALLLKISDQGKTLPEAFREMLLDFLVKEP